MRNTPIDEAGLRREAPLARLPPRVSRRALLRGASAALPAILTLQSGAALAQSSNLIGLVDDAHAAIGEGGRVQCLDMASAVGGTPSRLDLGPRPMLHVQYITQRPYYQAESDEDDEDDDDDDEGPDDAEPVSIERMCKQGGVYWYRDGGWRSTAPGYANRGIEAGFLVSATALSSFSSAIKVKSVF